MSYTPSDYSGWTREDLLVRVHELERAFRDPAIHPSFGLSPSEAAILSILVSRVGRVVSTETLMMLLHGARINPPNKDIISTQVVRLRDKLWPYGLDIDRVRIAGYLLKASPDEAAALALPEWEWPFARRAGTRGRMHGGGPKPKRIDVSGAQG